MSDTLTDCITFEARPQVMWYEISDGSGIIKQCLGVQLPGDRITLRDYRVTLTPVADEPELKPCPFCGGRGRNCANECFP